MFWLIPFIVAGVLFGTSATAVGAPTVFEFRTNDVIAFVGGADVAAAQHSGHVETLLAVAHPRLKLRFRNLGWEGDTVFEQPRDFAFPSLLTNLHRAGATVIVAQFGRGESLDRVAVPDFAAAYRKLLDTLAKQTPRILLVTPVPFEAGNGSLPDLSKRNPDLARIADAICLLGQERTLFVVDLFAELGGA
ncbi:MAG: hypothetical protein L0Y58_11745, partial [Verrucomicrobia subdivision 3 bacterium]|nr:hypothetical protein [Limisphaerales bacterium]